MGGKRHIVRTGSSPLARLVTAVWCTVLGGALLSCSGAGDGGPSDETVRGTAPATVPPSGDGGGGAPTTGPGAAPTTTIISPSTRPGGVSSTVDGSDLDELPEGFAARFDALVDAELAVTFGDDPVVFEDEDVAGQIVALQFEPVTLRVELEPPAEASDGQADDESTGFDVVVGQENRARIRDECGGRNGPDCPFDIDDREWVQQPIDDRDWEWDVTPQRSGSNTLRIELQPRIDVGGRVVDGRLRDQRVPIVVDVHPATDAIETALDRADDQVRVDPAGDELVVGDRVVVEVRTATPSDDVVLTVTGVETDSVLSAREIEAGDAFTRWEVRAVEPGAGSVRVDVRADAPAVSEQLSRDRTVVRPFVVVEADEPWYSRWWGTLITIAGGLAVLIGVPTALFTLRARHREVSPDEPR